MLCSATDNIWLRHIYTVRHRKKGFAQLYDGQYLATPYIYRPASQKNICSALDFCIYLRPVLGETFELIIKILELNILNEINYVLDT